MRHRERTTTGTIILAAALVLLLPVFATAQAVSVQLTATEVFDPLGLLPNGVAVGAFTNPGTVACPGHEPTGNPTQPCPPGSRMTFRDVGWQSRVMSSSPLLTGWFYNVGNNNFDANATGQVWGTFRIELDAGGVWHGSWTADRSKVGDMWVIRVLGVGRGIGGAIDGMQLRFTEVAPMPTFMPIVWLGSMDAEVLSPPIR
ncbi:MAG: hypothetical protein ACM3NQ_11145 [Bacteroidales bacterium]